MKEDEEVKDRFKLCEHNFFKRNVTRRQASMVELGEKLFGSKLSSAIKIQEDDGASQGSQQRYKLPILSKAAPAVFK